MVKSVPFFGSTPFTTYHQIMLKRVTHAPLVPVDRLFLCLMLADAVQGISGILIGCWASRGEVIEGTYRTIQGMYCGKS